MEEKSSKLKERLICWGICVVFIILAILAIVYIFRKKELEAEAVREAERQVLIEEERASLAAKAEEIATGEPRVRVESLLSAIEYVADMTSFKITTNINLNLQGSLISGNYIIDSETHIIQDATRYQMSNISTSNMDNIVAKAFYKDGYYYTDDKKGKNKEEKSEDEIKKTVYEVTSLVTDYSDLMDEDSIGIENVDGNTVYTYSIPWFIAEEYLTKLASSAVTDDTALKGASTEIESIQLTSTINQDGMLIKQQLAMKGSIKKVVFKIPADAEVIVYFEPTQENEIEVNW